MTDQKPTEGRSVTKCDAGVEGCGIWEIHGHVPSAPTDQLAEYPCADCGKLRTKAEGGTTFTVCDNCWGKHYPSAPTKPVSLEAPAGSKHTLLTCQYSEGHAGQCKPWMDETPAPADAAAETPAEAFARGRSEALTEMAVYSGLAEKVRELEDKLQKAQDRIDALTIVAAQTTVLEAALQQEKKEAVRREELWRLTWHDRRAEHEVALEQAQQALQRAEGERDEARATRDMHKERQEQEIGLRLAAEKDRDWYRSLLHLRTGETP